MSDTTRYSSATWRDAVVAALGRHGSPRWTIAGEGPWTSTWSLDVGRERLFVKAAPAASAAMLEAEADGLRALGGTPALAVPRVRVRGTQSDTAFLVLTWLDFGENRRGEALGHALAALHRGDTPSGPEGEPFGWHRDNFIGGTLQRNGWCRDWATFFRDRRLAPQIARATRGGYGNELARDGERLLERVPALLAGHEPAPALVHGDLWSGNAGTLVNGMPAVFDPAVYVGDRETDLAMTRLFGGFENGFYRAYEEAFPLPPGHEERRALYNLYHVLNHLNLFGGSYLERVQTMLGKLVSGESFASR